MAYPFNPAMSGAMMPAPRQQLMPVHYRPNQQKQELISTGPRRTSSLESPIMRLFGHEAEVYSAKFSPDGAMLAFGSFERLIFLWKVYGECENYCVLKGHQGAIMEVQYSSDGTLYSIATDKLGAVWDVEVGQRVKKLKGHSSYVNSYGASNQGFQSVCTGSDDGTIRVWDLRSRFSSHTFNNTYQVTSVCFSKSNDHVISGGLDNIIKVWDLRNEGEVLFTLAGHTDTVTGLAVSPDGSYLLSNSMDNTVRIWDIRPFAPTARQLKMLLGAQHNFEKNLLRCCWSPDGRKAAAGSADRFVCVWDTMIGQLVYKLPGHNGSVNDVDFHPKEPILLSCSSDKTLYLGELQ